MADQTFQVALREMITKLNFGLFTTSFKKLSHSRETILSMSRGHSPALYLILPIEHCIVCEYDCT